MSYSRHTQNVPLSILDGSDGELVVAFDWSAGTPPSGLSGPPENYDPGEDDEFVIIGSHYDGGQIPVGLGEQEQERVIEWLDENWERPDRAPDADYYRDMKQADKLLEGFEERDEAD